MKSCRAMSRDTARHKDRIGSNLAARHHATFRNAKIAVRPNRPLSLFYSIGRSLMRTKVDLVELISQDFYNISAFQIP
jgi:hypothetical protein